MCNEADSLPLLMVLRVDQKIVGVAPLSLRKSFGIRSARFLLRPELAPDFVLIPQYFSLSLKLINDFLFNKLNCVYFNFTFEDSSKTLKEFTERKLKIFTVDFPGHVVLRLPDTFEEFKKIHGKRFKRDFRLSERRLDSKGYWRIKQYTNENGTETTSTVYKQVLDIDKNSWKASWRVKHKVSSDLDLMAVLKLFSSPPNKMLDQSYRWFVWLLELEGLPISFQTGVTFKKRAFFIKTCYDSRFRYFSPGIYIINASIRGLIDEGKVKEIDFLSDFEYLRRWKIVSLSRITAFISNKRLIKFFQPILCYSMTFPLLSKPLRFLTYFLKF